MTLNRGVFPGRVDDDMYIGWAKTPAVDRRFLVAALPAMLAGVAGAAYVVASDLDDPGAGAWKTGALYRATGVLATRPYPMLRVADATAPDGVRSVLIVAQGKCTSALKLPANDGRSYAVAGALIERGARRMIEVPLMLGDWLTPADESAALPPPRIEPLGRKTLAGQIMDTKCFFGVMRPSRGKTHKACASLCIRGGIPPSFWAKGRDGRESVLLMTDPDGGPLGESILPFIADPVRIDGEVFRVDDLLQFRVATHAIARI